MFLIFIDGTALNSGQRLDYVNRTHLELASGNLVLQKTSSPGPKLLEILPWLWQPYMYLTEMQDEGCAPGLVARAH